MNVRDVNAEVFVDRRKANVDEVEGIFQYLREGILGRLAGVVAFVNELTAMTAEYEYGWIQRRRIDLQRRPQSFCETALDAQAGFPYWSGDKQMTGLFSNRTRNAARMMELFPNVDVFTPSMVDLYEGSPQSTSDPLMLAEYYSALHIASNGRFLPLVSFTPERAFKERHIENNKDYLKPLDLVRYCVEELGFIGVKVHPSSGFAPFNNCEKACPNTRGQRQKELSGEQKAFYEMQMKGLYSYCLAADIPILTHSGRGISANRGCMEKGSDPLEWTNSPRQWVEAMKWANVKATHDPWGNEILKRHELRVCLAHMAGGFDGEGKPDPWLVLAAKEMCDVPGLYLDLAHVDDLYLEESDIISGTYRQAFQEFLSENPQVIPKLMYGTDWHMPRVAGIGRRYLREVKYLIPQEMRRQVMGLTAVKFFGLEKGRATRKRLEVLYIKNDVPLEKVAWIAKVDRVVVA